MSRVLILLVIAPFTWGPFFLWWLGELQLSWDFVGVIRTLVIPGCTSVLVAGIFLFRTRLPLTTALFMGGIGLLITLIAIYVIWRALRVNPDGILQINWDQINWDNLTVGALLLLIGVFVLGVPLTRSIDHPFSRVQIFLTKPEDPTRTVLGEAEVLPEEGWEEEEARSVRSSGSPVKGWLVAHTEACWHLFLEAEESKAEQSRQLVSIPDEIVSEAHYEEPSAVTRRSLWSRLRCSRGESL
jgi:hypothetical protein